jgi:alpha-ketoglutarate-dependent taurine dioxygenase
MKDGILVDQGHEFSLERFGEFTSQFGEGYKAHTVTERVPAGPPEYVVHEVPDLNVGMNLHAESSYAQHHPEFVALTCETVPAIGGRTTILDGRKFLEAMSPDLRAAWESCTIEWRWPYEKDDPAVINGAFCSTLLSCFEYQTTTPMAPIPNLTTISPEMLAETQEMSHYLCDHHAWTPGDIVVLDNRRWIHGREPWLGERRVYVQTIRAPHL